jgi:ankyrin repeat protein
LDQFEKEMISILYAIISSEASNSKPVIMKKKQKPSSLSSYIYHPSESIKRLFGVHSKTKRSLAEEAESGDEFSVSSWIRSGANPNEYDAYGYTPLLNAAANGRLEAVKNLIKNGASINMTGPYNYTALLAASQVSDFFF